MFIASPIEAKSIKAKNVQPGFDEKPFDSRVEKLPTNYKGHNLKLLWEVLSKIKTHLIKSEFETTDNYNGRVAKIKTATLAGRLPLDSIFCFVLDPKDYKSLYSADHKKFTLTIGGLFPLTTPTFTGYDIDFQSDKYQGTNAFGVSKIVTRFNQESVKLEVTNPEAFFKKSIWYEPLEIIFPNIESDVAPSLKEYLKVLVVFSVPDIQMHDYYSESKPTINDPTEYNSVEHYIKVRLKEIWVFDITSGNIWKKLKADNGR
jgi:hypothetical protein